MANMATAELADDLLSRQVPDRSAGRIYRVQFSDPYLLANGTVIDIAWYSKDELSPPPRLDDPIH